MVELIKNELYAVEVEETWVKYWGKYAGSEKEVKLHFWWEEGHGLYIKLPFKTISLFKDITEEQAEGLVEKSDSPVWYAMFKDYSRSGSGFWMATGSLKSLLKSKGLDPSTKNYLLIKKNI